jgi:hypothetical protein
MVQRGELCLFLGKKAGQHLTLRLIGLDGKLPAEVLDVCSGDELVHEERASNAPTLRPHSDSIKEAISYEPMKPSGLGLRRVRISAYGQTRKHNT